jgi:hypothetical protein
MLNLQQAQAALTQRSNSTFVTPQQVEQLLQNVRGTTLASIVQVTDVASVAAKHKANKVQKVTQASVQLFNNVKDFANVYTAAVKRSAGSIADNDVAKVADFEQQDNYFTHTATFSLCQHKADSTKYYLFAIYNNANSMYFINNDLATKDEVAALLQPAAAKKLVEGNTIVHNKANDIMHDVQVRTIALTSIVQLNAQKQSLVV